MWDLGAHGGSAKSGVSKGFFFFVRGENLNNWGGACTGSNN